MTENVYFGGRGVDVGNLVSFVISIIVIKSLLNAKIVIMERHNGNLPIGFMHIKYDLKLFWKLRQRYESLMVWFPAIRVP